MSVFVSSLEGIAGLSFQWKFFFSWGSLVLQISLALGRDLGSFWSMSSICAQVRGGRKMMKEGREEGGREEGRKERGREGRWRPRGEWSENETVQVLKTCRNVCIYPPAVSVHHCSLPSLVQKKPRGNGDHLDIIRTSLYSYKLPITNLHYLVHQRREIGTLEGFLETGHLIEDTPESPYVTLGIVGASLTLKRSKVILIQVFSAKIVIFFSPIRQSFPLYSICMRCLAWQTNVWAV